MANIIRPYLQAGATVADAEAMLRTHPHVAQYFAAMAQDKSNKSRSRVAIAKAYGDAIGEALLPRQKAGRPLYEGPFALLSAPARDAITDKLELSRGSLGEVEWTPEKSSAAADALVEKYKPNDNSVAMALKNLRHGLFVRLAIHPKDARANPITGATFREEITIAANATAATRLKERADVGIEVPPPYEQIGALVDRAKAFVAMPAATPMTAADLLVILSARPGEAETLVVGDRGGITGMLKKRDDDKNAYNLVSVVGEQLARQYLEAWRALPLGPKRTAMSGLGPLAASWGLQRRDLRAVGAALAVRAEAMEGRVGNTAQARAIHAAALRHVPGRASPQEHYERVRDPLAQLHANLAELSAEDLAEVRALVAARAARAK